jgi:hypothetical protein
MLRSNEGAMRLLRLAAVVAVTMGLGCSQDKPDKPVPSRTKDENSETGMSEPVPLEYLNELVSDAAQWLAVELPNRPEVVQSKEQFVFGVPQTLETGGLRLPDGRVRQSLDRLSSELSQNQKFTDSFLVISATEAAAKSQIGTVAGKDTSGFRDPLQRDRDNTKPAVYDPQRVYIMSGKFYGSTDQAAGRRAYHLFVRIEKPQSRARVLDRDFAYNLRWDGKKGKWLREE